MSIVQPVHLLYDADPGQGQDIPSVDPTVGGEGLQVYFDHESQDPHGHHANGGGISLINGPSAPSGSSGYDVWGDVDIWCADLWAPDPSSRTEIQMWFSLCEVRADGSSGPTVWTTYAREKHAPLQHDDNVWDASGNVVKDGPNHRRCNYHTGRGATLFVPRNRRLRFHVAQYHGRRPDGQILVPGYDKPYPGYVRKAAANLLAIPR